MAKNIFRKVSIERLSSPEQLDQLMQVTSARSWIAIVALCGLLLTAVGWSIYGSIPTRVQGTGVLIKTGGVYDVVPRSGGQVTDVAVRAGDSVREGQVIARLDQPLLLEEINNARKRLEELNERHKQLVAFGSEDVRLQEDLARQERESLENSIQGAQDRLDWLDERIQSQQTLYDDGLITKQVLIASQQERQAVEERIESLEGTLKQVKIRELTTLNQRKQEAETSRMQISELEREIVSLRDRYRMASEVISPYTGRILEVMVQAGTIVSQGQPVMRLDRLGSSVEELEAVLYVSGVDGKKVRPGMEVQVSPTMVKREEYGFIRARVVRVSDFPSTADGMMRTLKNDQLVRTFLQAGAPYEVRATLQLDDTTPSGFEWSSSSGPDAQIQSGTIATATVTVEDHRPIALVMPAVKRFFGL
jgi:HlyD family secretion protein